MRSLSRVVWSEGMHLAQHHFQAQSRYFEELAGFTLSNLFFRPYGLVGYELDAEALLNGTVSLRHARGVMPDGLAFHFPGDPPPPPLDVRERFSPAQDAHLVLLAVPAWRPGGGNCAPAEGAGSARFVAATEPLRDETTGQDEKPVALARKNFRLVLDTEAAPELVALPLARVRRDRSGHFVYDPDYVPPCLQIGASDRLMRLLGGLVDTLDAKADAMMRERPAAGGVRSGYAPREIASFWLAHAIHSSQAPLRHLFHARTPHPEQLYVELSRLAGALCTFSLDSAPGDLPLYDHDALDRCFDALERHVRGHLDAVIPTGCITVPLGPAEEHFFTGAVTDRRCLAPSHWFLGVRSSAGQGEVIDRVPKLVKLCSTKHIVRLVREAYPGLPLEHVPSPPAEISPRLGTQYFRVRTDGPCWSSIVETEQVGVYAPGAIPDAQLELLVVPGG
ncbi:MAG: type VI secretion system baseplate subunit TssK [Gemmatimonadota bacterium]